MISFSNTLALIPVDDSRLLYVIYVIFSVILYGVLLYLIEKLRVDKKLKIKKKRKGVDIRKLIRTFAPRNRILCNKINNNI